MTSPGCPCSGEPSATANRRSCGTFPGGGIAVLLRNAGPPPMGTAGAIAFAGVGAVAGVAVASCPAPSPATGPWPKGGSPMKGSPFGFGWPPSPPSLGAPLPCLQHTVSQCQCSALLYFDKISQSRVKQPDPKRAAQDAFTRTSKPMRAHASICAVNKHELQNPCSSIKLSRENGQMANTPPRP